MDEWTPKLKLISVLAATHVFLRHSREEGWPDEKPQDAAAMVEGMMAHLLDSRRELPRYWQVLFAPTGPAQEIAMANDWHDDYMKLAAEFDELVFLLKPQRGG